MQEKPLKVQQSTLYIVATPIGNLGDISSRAIEILKKVDFIAVEDTRHSGPLLKHFNIATKMFAFHEHNESEQGNKVLNLLSQGNSIALISDAGTPLISDPGYHLVYEARKSGYSVVPIPGACAAITALSASGLPSDRFVFEGFLPAKSNARIQKLEKLLNQTRTIIFYESPHRILASLKDMVAVFGEERFVVIARELTKFYETIRGDKLSDLLKWLEAHTEQQCGEFVVLVQGCEEKIKIINDADLKVLDILLKEMPLKQAVKVAADITGKKKNDLYKIALDKETIA